MLHVNVFTNTQVPMQPVCMLEDLEYSALRGPNLTNNIPKIANG